MNAKKVSTQKTAEKVLDELSRKTKQRWRIPPSFESDPSRVELALRERIKELNCLYGITRFAEDGPESMEIFLKRVVNILPPSWQYPEITCARIVFDGKTYRSPKFKATKWRQSTRIQVFAEPAGEVEIFYTKQRPPLYEGPFLKEERTLLDAVAERIGTVGMRISSEKQLQETNKQLMVERKALQETNTALRTVLARIEEEKQTIYKDIRANVEKVVMPIIFTLLVEIPQPQRKYVELLRDNLIDIASPFISRITDRCAGLTPTEIGICNMIREGMRSKEIAQLRTVAPATISRHRERIRKKLGIANTDTNLTSYLRSIM